MDAIAMDSGHLGEIIRRYKYNARGRGWALILGRLIVGWLNAAQPFVDVIVANPAATTRQPHQHMELILDAAAKEDPHRSWPIATSDEPVLLKHRATPRSAGGDWHGKWTAAREHAEAIEIVNPGRISGARILLVDDMFTTGTQLAAVSLLLRQAGAQQVNALVIARVPWNAR